MGHILDDMFPMLGGGLMSEENERFEIMFKFLRAYPGTTLVYVALQAQAETHASVLRQQGFNAAAFHAGMKTEEKQRIQDDFMSSKIQIVSQSFSLRVEPPRVIYQTLLSSTPGLSESAVY